MKYIFERKNYSRKQIIKGLYKSIKNGEIYMDITPDEFIHRSLDPQNPEIGSFESMVNNSFISMGDEHRMGEYIKRFKKLNINTKKLDKMFPKYQEYLKYPLDPPFEESDFFNWREYDDDDRDNDPKYIKDLKEYEAYDKWEDEGYKHEKVREEFNDEVRRLCKIAKKKLDL